MAKILVTGGAGFIGSHVVDRYIEEGHEVAVVDNLSTGLRANLNPKAKFYEVDIRSKDLAQVFSSEKPQVVSHHAAQVDVRQSVQDPLFDAQANILGSINLLEQCGKQGIEKFIYASTGGAVYGEPAQLPASEDVAPKPICHYGVSKYAVEHYIHLYHVLYKLCFTILRYPNVYGPRQNPHGEAGVCAILTGKMLEGERPTLYGNGDPLRDYVYVGDIARAGVLALSKGDGETLNLGSGKGTSVLEIFLVLKQLLGFKEEPILEPLRPGEVREIYITGDRAAAVLGWKPTVDLREGLEKTVEHVRDPTSARPS